MFQFCTIPWPTLRKKPGSFYWKSMVESLQQVSAVCAEGANTHLYPLPSNSSIKLQQESDWLVCYFALLFLRAKLDNSFWETEDGHCQCAWKAPFILSLRILLVKVALYYSLLSAIQPSQFKQNQIFRKERDEEMELLSQLEEMDGFPSVHPSTAPSIFTAVKEQWNGPVVWPCVNTPFSALAQLGSRTHPLFVIRKNPRGKLTGHHAG